MADDGLKLTDHALTPGAQRSWWLREALKAEKDPAPCPRLTAAANADVSSVGDTSKKYHRASRAKDFAAEQKVTEQLNQQASAAAKPTQTASNQ